MKNMNNPQGVLIGLAIGTIGLMTSWAISKVMDKQMKKNTDKVFKDNLAMVHYVDQLEGLNADLGHKIEIAKTALEEDDVFLWNQELGE